MKQMPLWTKLILTVFCLMLPGAAFAAETPGISSVSPSSLAMNYANQVDIKATGVNTNFQMGQSTVAILDSEGKVVDFSGPVKEVVDKTNLVFSLNSGLPTGIYQVRVTTGNEVAIGGSLTVRGVPSISLSPDQLAVGYQTTEISVYGVNTGFSDKTIASIVNQAGVIQEGAGGTPRITNGNLLSVSIAPGLAEGNYKLIVRTENEEAEAGFTVASPSAVLRYNGNSFNGMPTGYFSDYDLIIKGTFTTFSGTTEVKLLAGSQNGTDKSEFLSGVNVTNKESISLTVKKGLSPGQYYLTANTDGQQITTTFTVFSPQISGIAFISELAQGSILPEGYRKTKVEIYGFNTAFNNNTTVRVNGMTENLSGIIMQTTTRLSFDLLPGLSGGSHEILVDLDGNSLTLEDQITRSFTISQPDITKLNGKVILGSVEPASIIVTGSNTHFTKGSPKVTVGGAAGAQIISVSVVDDTNLVFRVLPSSFSTPGAYSIIVETVGLEIGESAQGNGLLLVENSGINVSPGVIYLDELGSKVMTVKGTGTSFQAGSEVTLGGVKVTPTVKSTTEIVFVAPQNVSLGAQTVTVKSGDKSYQTTLEVAARTISLSITSKSFGYEAFNLVVTGKGVTFDSSSNKPSVSVAGYGTVNSNTAEIAANKFAFQMPAGLSVGSHQISVSFQQGSYAQIGTLKADFVINPISSLVFKMNQVVVTKLTVIEGEADFVLMTEAQQSNGSYVNCSNEAGLTVSIGSDVIGLTKVNNTIKVSVSKAGTARITAAYGEQQTTLEIEVLAKNTAPGGSTGGTAPGGETGSVPGSGNTKTPGNSTGNIGTTTSLPSSGTPVNSNNSPGTAAQGSFTDTINHWAKTNIDRLVASGAVKGYSNGSFKPDARITRAEFATVLAKAMGLELEGIYQLTFKDTSSIPIWARPTVSAVVRAGIVGGYTDGTFRANNQVTRAEIAVMVAKALQLKGLPGTSLSFTDNYSIPSWAKESVLAAVQKGIISGYGDKTFRANSQATRAEAVTMIVRMQDYFNSIKG